GRFDAAVAAPAADRGGRSLLSAPLPLVTDHVLQIAGRRLPRPDRLPAESLRPRQLGEGADAAALHPRPPQQRDRRRQRFGDLPGGRLDLLLRPGPPALPRKAGRPLDGAGGRHVPGDRHRQPAFPPVQRLGVDQLQVGADPAERDLYPSDLHLDPERLFPGSAGRTGGGGSGRRLHPAPGLHPDRRPPRRAGGFHHGDPPLHRRLERVPLRADLHERAEPVHGSRRDRPVRRLGHRGGNPLGRDHRRRRRLDPAARDPGPPLPAPHHLRADGGGGQGV
ncbi:MAG: Maltodextrin ABC transporter, permease protein MdxG, partial [uncultured Thermomicrobiales bacterium]